MRKKFFKIFLKNFLKKSLFFDFFLLPIIEGENDISTFLDVTKKGGII